MIFYFSGTGNSKYIADRLAACFDEELVNIADAVNNSNFTFDCSDEKYVGFVFPTYAWSIPYVVKDFVVNMELDNIPDDAYVFAINNCGASEGRSLYDLSKLLEDKNIKLNFTRSLILPDNYIVMLNPPDKEEQSRIIRRANVKMANIINNISREKKSLYIHKGILFFGYKLLNFLFRAFMNKTSKFYVKDNCVGCGLCGEICSTKAIEIQDNKPVWVSKSCVQCLACINRCPVQAIEYGKKTEGKDRYINPIVKFDKTVDISEIQSDNEVFSAEEDTDISYTDNRIVEDIINNAEDNIEESVFDNISFAKKVIDITEEDSVFEEDGSISIENN